MYKPTSTALSIILLMIFIGVEAKIISISDKNTGIKILDSGMPIFIFNEEKRSEIKHLDALSNAFKDIIFVKADPNTDEGRLFLELVGVGEKSPAAIVWLEDGEFHKYVTKGNIALETIQDALIDYKLRIAGHHQISVKQEYGKGSVYELTSATWKSFMNDPNNFVAILYTRENCKLCDDVKCHGNPQGKGAIRRDCPSH